jgi:hypothetical protein
MNALIKTLFGDRRNLGVVAAVMAVEFALVRFGAARAATLAVPAVIFAGTIWLSVKG